MCKAERQIAPRTAEAHPFWLGRGPLREEPGKREIKQAFTNNPEVHVSQHATMSQRGNAIQDPESSRFYLETCQNAERRGRSSAQETLQLCSSLGCLPQVGSSWLPPGSYQNTLDIHQGHSSCSLPSSLRSSLCIALPHTLSRSFESFHFL